MLKYMFLCKIKKALNFVIILKNVNEIQNNLPSVPFACYYNSPSIIDPTITSLISPLDNHGISVCNGHCAKGIHSEQPT